MCIRDRPYETLFDAAIHEKTGPEAMICVRAEAEAVKKRLCALEDGEELGRLLFTSYARDGFSREDQIRLRECCDDLNRRKIKFMLSNSATEFIQEQYAAYHITMVQARRAINSDALRRGQIAEVIVRNYE